MKKVTPFIMIFSIIGLTSCTKDLISDRYANTPIENFIAFTEDFADHYSAFDAKRVNWDSLTLVYRRQIAPTNPNDSLFIIFCAILDVLNDGHADIYAPEFGYYRSYNRRNKPFFEGRSTNSMQDVVVLQNFIRNKYLGGHFGGWLFFYGKIDSGQRKIGYICLPTFDLAEYPVSFLQEAVSYFEKADDVVIDLRFNGGGRTEAFVFTHNLFGSHEAVYLKSRFRSGNGSNEFSPMVSHRVQPHNPTFQGKPMAILTNAYTASSSDHFVLAIKTQPNVITVGDTTCGAFSAVLERLLPNGWKYRLGAQVVFNPEGNYLCDERGQYLEGLGIIPDYVVADKWNMVVN